MMRTPTDNLPKKTPIPHYSPSVPVSVYRELALELQAVQAKFDIATTHNQKLIQENQELRQEITKVIKGFAYLQKLVDSSVLPGSHPPLYDHTPLTKTPQHLDTSASPPRKNSSTAQQPAVSPPINKPQYIEFLEPKVAVNHPISEPTLIPEKEIRYYSNSESNLNSLSGWWLVLAIILIILTGFSAGYLFVHPLFQHQNQQQLKG